MQQDQYLAERPVTSGWLVAGSCGAAEWSEEQPRVRVGSDSALVTLVKDRLAGMIHAIAVRLARSCRECTARQPRARF